MSTKGNKLCHSVHFYQNNCVCESKFVHDEKALDATLNLASFSMLSLTIYLYPSKVVMGWMDGQMDGWMDN